MTKVKLYSHPVTTQFIAPRLSLAYIFSAVCTILTLVLPFYLCFSPRYALRNNINHDSLNARTTLGTPVGIWLKHDTYREQPKVNFKYRIIFVAQAVEKVANGKNVTLLPRELYYSTYEELNEKRQQTFRSASTTSREADDNVDGVVDRLLLNIKLPLKCNEDVYGLQALVFVNYKLVNHVKMEIESLIHVHHEAGIAGSKFVSIGDLNLRQMKPIPIFSGRSNSNTRLYFDDDLVDIPSALFEPSATNIGNILKRYQSRSIAADYVERFPIWTRQIESSSISNAETEDAGNKKGFELDLTVTIPKMQSIVYIPTLVEVLTEAWVRYFSLLVVVGCLAHLLFKYVFSNQILRTDIVVS